MKCFFIGLFILFSTNSISQTTEYYSRINPEQIDILIKDTNLTITEKPYALNDSCFFAIESYTDTNGMPMRSLVHAKKSGDIKRFRSSGYYTEYGETFYFYEYADKTKPKILILEIEHEYSSQIQVFVIYEEFVKYAGILDVGNRQMDLDSRQYPVSDIYMYTSNTEIIFGFKSDLSLFQHDGEQLIKANKLVYIYNGDSLLPKIED